MCTYFLNFYRTLEFELKKLSQSINFPSFQFLLFINNRIRVDILQHCRAAILVLKILKYGHTNSSIVIVLPSPTLVSERPPLARRFQDLAKVNAWHSWMPSGAIAMAHTVLNSVFHWLLIFYSWFLFVLNLFISHWLISFILDLGFKPKNHECMTFR